MPPKKNPEKKEREIKTQGKLISLRSREFKKKSASPFKEMPADFCRHITGFLSAKQIAIAARVSSSFLRTRNGKFDFKEVKNKEKEALINESFVDFTPAGYARFDELLKFKNERLELSSLQQLLLQGRQTTPTQQRFFVFVRAQVLAGKLSLAAALREIDKLDGLVEGVTPLGESVFAKAWIADLKEWEKITLRVGFLHADLCSDWMSQEHAKLIFDQFPQGGHRSDLFIRSIQGLKKYQVSGLRLGFSLDDVRSDWFSPVHVEVQGPPFNLGFMRNMSQAHVVVSIPEDSLENIYLAAKHNCAAIITTLLAELPPLRILQVILTRPDPKPSLRIENSLIAAVVPNNVGAIAALLERLTPAQRLLAILHETKGSPNALSCAVTLNHKKAIAALLKGLSFVQKLAAIQHPRTTFDAFPGNNALHIAVLSNLSSSVTALLAGLTFDQRYQTVLGLNDAFSQGQSYVFLAVTKDYVGTVSALLTGLMPSQILSAILAQQGGGPYQGQNALFFAVSTGSLWMVSALLAGLMPSQILSAILAPQGEGANFGENALFAAVKGQHYQVIGALLEKLTPAQRLRAITDWSESPTVVGTPLYNAMQQKNLSTMCALLLGLTPEQKYAAIFAARAFRKISMLDIAAIGIIYQIKKILLSSQFKMNYLMSSSQGHKITGNIYDVEENNVPRSAYRVYNMIRDFEKTPSKQYDGLLVEIYRELQGKTEVSASRTLLPSLSLWQRSKETAGIYADIINLLSPHIVLMVRSLPNSTRPPAVYARPGF